MSAPPANALQGAIQKLAFHEPLTAEDAEAAFIDTAAVNPTVSVGNNTVALTQGSQTLTVAPSGTTRLPPVASLDVSIRKFWQISGVKLEPRLDLTLVQISRPQNRG